MISPDGSFLNHFHTRMSGQNPVQVPRGNQGDYVTVYDEWLMSPLAQNDHLYAQSPFNENNGVFIGYGLLTISTTPLSIYSTNWCGFQTCPQQWDWGMQKMWIAGFGPYDGSPWNYSPTWKFLESFEHSHVRTKSCPSPARESRGLCYRV